MILVTLQRQTEERLGVVASGGNHLRVWLRSLLGAACGDRRAAIVGIVGIEGIVEDLR